MEEKYGDYGRLLRSLLYSFDFQHERGLVTGEERAWGDYVRVVSVFFSIPREESILMVCLVYDNCTLVRLKTSSEVFLSQVDKYFQGYES